MTDFRLHRVDVTQSTNDDVKHAAEAGEDEGYAVLAERQTAGRGRYGRQWDSPAGNLYLSLLLRPRHTLNFSCYSFVAALALADTVKYFLPQAPVNLKWPNDVLLDGKKVGGILLETVADGVVIGMGLNVTTHPDNSFYPSTSLAKAGLTIRSIEPIASHLLEKLRYWHFILEMDGFTPIRAAWLNYAIKGQVRVRLPHEAVQGTFLDLGQNGTLLLRLADGSERSIASGDVFYPAGPVNQD